MYNLILVIFMVVSHYNLEGPNLKESGGRQAEKCLKEPLESF